MRFLLFFILFFFSNAPFLLASDIDPIALEGQIRTWYTDYKRTATLPTKELRRSATFVGHLHRHLLEQDTEEGVDLYSRAILAVVGRGAGVGGLRTPRNDADKSYLLTSEEKAIVKSALIDAERLRRKELDLATDYFGTPEDYFKKAKDGEQKFALSKHAKVVQNMARKIFSLHVYINDPEMAREQEMSPHLLKALTHLDLSKSTTLPRIYQTRHSIRNLSDFDIFNMAFLDQSAMTEILTQWGHPRHDIPLVYYTLQGLPNSISDDLRTPVAQEISTLSSKRLAKRLLTETGQTEEAILETLGTKSIRGIQSTLILEIFLNKYLPETGGASMDPNMLLHLFKMAGKEIDNDPHRTEICLRALERFMRACPDCPLAQIVEALISGISYSPNDQMTDFYLEGIRKVYLAASERYHDTDKSKILESIRPVFGAVYESKEYKELINTILAGLLKMDCLGIKDIGKFADGSWVNSPNEQALVDKFGVLVQEMVDPGTLLGLVHNKNINTDCKFLIPKRLVELGAFDVLFKSFRAGARIDRKILELFKTHGRLSPPLLISVADFISIENVNFLFELTNEVTWTEEERAKLAKSIGTNGSLDGLSGGIKKAEKFTPIIQSLTRSDLLLGFMSDEKMPSQLKVITARRLAELGYWDQLTGLLRPNGNDKIVFQEILKLLQTGGQLSPGRMILAASVIRIQDASDSKLKEEREAVEKDARDTIDNLLTTASSVIYTQAELDEFTQTIATNLRIGQKEADLWNAEYIATRVGDLASWDRLTRLLSPNGKDKKAFKRILQFLKINHQLNADRMIFAAGVIQTKSAVDDLLTKARDVTFNEGELDEFAARIGANPAFGAPEANLWKAEYKAATSNTEEDWDGLTHLLAPNSRDKTAFIRILGFLNDHKKLYAERIIIAARCADTQEAADDLLEKAKVVVFSIPDLDNFITAIRENTHWIGDKKAEKWMVEKTNKLAELKRWDELTNLLIPNSSDKDGFKKILKLLNDNSQLTGQRVILAAHFVGTPEAGDDLLEKAKKVVFVDNEFFHFVQAATGNDDIGAQKAQAWAQVYGT
ncbi:MAG: hypothetical protein K2Q34_01595 [Alphaproteobacteria bacterium]|nr:hypothetical protein [Alphaproteobacteria bacterium]